MRIGEILGGDAPEEPEPNLPPQKRRRAAEVVVVKEEESLSEEDILPVQTTTRSGRAIRRPIHLDD